MLGSHPLVCDGLALAPLLDRLRVHTKALRQRPYALLTSLDCAPHGRCRSGAAVANLAHSASFCAWLTIPLHSGTEQEGECADVASASDVGSWFVPITSDLQSHRCRAARLPGRRDQPHRQRPSPKPSRRAPALGLSDHTRPQGGGLKNRTPLTQVLHQPVLQRAKAAFDPTL